MASMRAAVLILLPPMSVLLVVAARILCRSMARNLSALARAQLACLATTSGSSSFRHLPAESKRAISEVLRVAPYSSSTRMRGRNSCKCEEEEEDDEVVECVVCLSSIEEGEEIRELRCRHLFHRSCLDGWLARPVAPTCPLCRCRLLEGLHGQEGHEEEEEEDSDMMLFMACVHGRSSWFWPSSS